MNLELNLLELKEKLLIKKENDKTFIFDPIRKKYLVLQPEELVRQLFIQHLVKIKKYPINKISLESGIKVNQLQKRTDIIVFDKNFRPHILVECKAPQIKLDETVFRQASIYNLSLEVPIIIITNGMHTYCSKIDYENKSFALMNCLPQKEEFL